MGKMFYYTKFSCLISIIYTLFNNFSSTEILPSHPPFTTLYMRTLNAATQKKVLHKKRLPVFVDLSLLISLWMQHIGILRYTVMYLYKKTVKLLLIFELFISLFFFICSYIQCRSLKKAINYHVLKLMYCTRLGSPVESLHESLRAQMLQGEAEYITQPQQGF